jgi:ACDE family multidrug resistance protein
MQNKKNMVFILSTVPFLMVLGNSMLIPEFPAIKSALDITQFQAGLLITFFSAPAAVAIPFLGYLSDRVGRKIIICPALILYGLGGAVSGFSAAFMKDPLSYDPDWQDCSGDRGCRHGPHRHGPGRRPF